MSTKQKKRNRILYLAIALLSLFLLGQCYEIYQEISSEGYTTVGQAKEQSYRRYGLPEVNLSELYPEVDDR